MNIQIKNYAIEDKADILLVWEKSVLATHHFLLQSDFIEIKEMLQNFNFEDIKLFCLINENKKIIGFIGVNNTKIEMLFLGPNYFGKGLGHKLLDFAISNCNAKYVDVNEQNTKAIAFYEKFGFEIYEKTEKDDMGKPYPILKMKLKNRDEF